MFSVKDQTVALAQDTVAVTFGEHSAGSEEGEGGASNTVFCTLSFPKQQEGLAEGEAPHHTYTLLFQRDGDLLSIHEAPAPVGEPPVEGGDGEGEPKADGEPGTEEFSPASLQQPMAMAAEAPAQDVYADEEETPSKSSKKKK